MQPDDAHSDARSDAADSLARLIELWPRLSPDDRIDLLNHAEHLAAITDEAGPVT